MVVKVQNSDAEGIHVEYHPSFSCHGCQICASKKRTFTLPKRIPSAKSGDELILSFSTVQVFWLVFLTFLLPSLLALFGVILGSMLNFADPLPSLLGLAGIVLGWSILALCSHFYGRKFLPNIIGVIPHE